MYKERSSAVGQIMTNPRSKSEVLSETAKTRIEEKFLEDQFGIKKEFWSKATDKGISEEHVSIDLMVRQFGMFGAKKNEIFFENDFLTGTPDVIYNGIVYDIKTSFSGSTFPFFANEIPSKAYFYQLQAYMNLTGLRSAKLIYCLVDTPEQMIQDEIRRQTWKKGLIDSTPELEAEVYSQMTFEHIPYELRIRSFNVEYCEETIKAIEERVILCREYYNTLKTTINNRLNTKANV